MPVLLTRTWASSASRVEVAEAPMGHVVYPVATDDSIRGKVRLQIIIASNGVVKQIRALSGKATLSCLVAIWPRLRSFCDALSLQACLRCSPPVWP